MALPSVSCRDFPPTRLDLTLTLNPKPLIDQSQRPQESKEQREKLRKRALKEKKKAKQQEELARAAAEGGKGGTLESHSSLDDDEGETLDPAERWLRNFQLKVCNPPKAPSVFVPQRSSPPARRAGTLDIFNSNAAYSHALCILTVMASSFGLTGGRLYVDFQRTSGLAAQHRSCRITRSHMMKNHQQLVRLGCEC